MTVQQGHRVYWQEEEDRNSSNDGAQEISVTFWAEKKMEFKDRKNQIFLCSVKNEKRGRIISLIKFLQFLQASNYCQLRRCTDHFQTLSDGAVGGQGSD